MELERQNPHWEKDHLYPYERKRFGFEEIKKSSDSGLVTAMYGLRRVGKTVIQKQLINEAIKKGVGRPDIFYFSFDEKTADFWEVVHEYEKQIGKKVSRANYLFFDEIQKVPDWGAKVKTLYDTSSAHIAVSGSNSSLLRKGGESMAGRISEFVVPELSFKEFLYFKGREELYASSLEETVENEFWDFIKKPLPELVINSALDQKAYVETISRKIIFEDLPAVFPIDEPALLSTLFSLICKNPGMMLEYNALASDLGRDRQTISKYLDYLRYGFLVRKVSNYSKNQLTMEKKLKKFYPALACFADASKDKEVETVVAQMLKARYFWNFSNRYEVDFVCLKPLCAYEVKYQESMTKGDMDGLDRFRTRFKEARIKLVTKKKFMGTVPYYRLENFLEDNKLQPTVRIEDLLH